MINATSLLVQPLYSIWKGFNIFLVAHIINTGSWQEETLTYLTYWGDFSPPKEAIDSVINQTYDNWHLWVIDDCYPSSEATVTRLSLILRQPTSASQNLGITKTFNYALQKLLLNIVFFGLR